MQTMIQTFTRAAGAAGLLSFVLASPANASCRVIGDSVGVGLGQALRSCATSARIGISSQAAASRVRGGGEWLVVSLGSNDFPRGITSRQRVASDAHVRAALSRVMSVAGGRVIVVVPANGAHATVASWVAAHGVRSVSFVAGRDGIHPNSYAELASRVRAAMGDE